MQIHGGSEQSGTNLFLHAGYVSANPREFGRENGFHHYFDEESVHEITPLVINLDEALQLKTETTASTEQTVYLTPAAIGMNNEQHFVGVITLLTLSALCYVFHLDKKKRKPEHKGLTVSLLLFFGLMGVGVTNIVFLIISLTTGRVAPLTPLPPAAWESTTFQKQEYLHPHDATVALMHGVVYDSFANTSRPIKTLRDIQEEISLPTATPTPGQKYALKAYGLDGWGNPFELIQKPTQDEPIHYTLTSAGPDQEPDTSDDITISLLRRSDRDWDRLPPTFYLQENSEKLIVLYHRWSGKNFLYFNEERAQAITKTDQFDIYKRTEDRKDQIKFLEQRYGSSKTELSPSPIVMVSWYPILGDFYGAD